MAREWICRKNYIRSSYLQNRMVQFGNKSLISFQVAFTVTRIIFPGIIKSNILNLKRLMSSENINGLSTSPPNHPRFPLSMFGDFISPQAAMYMPMKIQYPGVSNCSIFAEASVGLKRSGSTLLK